MARKKPAPKKSRNRLAVKKVPVKDLPPGKREGGVKGGFEIQSPLINPIAPGGLTPLSPKITPPYVPVAPLKFPY